MYNLIAISEDDFNYLNGEISEACYNLASRDNEFITDLLAREDASIFTLQSHLNVRSPYAYTV